MPSRERRQTCSIMLTTDTSGEQQQRNTKDTVVVLFIFSSPGVILEHSSICETSRPCNSCYSTVTPNCRYVVFPSVTDCLLFGEAPGIWDPPVIQFPTPTHRQIPKSQQLKKVIWNKKLVIKPHLTDNSADNWRRVEHDWLHFFSTAPGATSIQHWKWQRRVTVWENLSLPVKANSA